MFFPKPNQVVLLPKAKVDLVMKTFVFCEHVSLVWKETMNVTSGRWHAVPEHLKVMLDGYLGCNSWSAEALIKLPYLQVMSENVLPVYW